MSGRKVRTGPTYLSEIKFAGTARGDHFHNQKTLTEKHYDMYVSADTLPGFVVLTSKLGHDEGTVYILPIEKIESARVAERSLTRYQPLGTAPAYDTKTGNKQMGSMPKRSKLGRPVGPSKKKQSDPESDMTD